MLLLPISVTGLIYAIRPDNFVLFGFMVFAYIGTEGPLNLAGELKESGKSLHDQKSSPFWRRDYHDPPT